MWSINDIGKIKKQIKWLREQILCLKECCGNTLDSDNIIYTNTDFANETIGGFLTGQPITPEEGLTLTQMWDKLFDNIVNPTASMLFFNLDLEIGQAAYSQAINIIYNQNTGGAPINFYIEENGVEVAGWNNGDIYTESDVLNSKTVQGFVEYDDTGNIPSGIVETAIYNIRRRLKIWHAPLSSIPTNSIEVRAIGLSNSSWQNVNNISLETGTTHTNFVVAVPTSINSSGSLSAQDITNNVSLTYTLVNSIDVALLNGDLEEYGIFVLSIDNPYPVNAIHQINIQ